MRGYFRRLRSMNAKEIIRLLLPKRIDQILYEVALGSYEPQQFAKVELEIKKTGQGGVLHYDALVNGNFAHRSNLSYDVYLPAQFGYGKSPVIGDCVTKPKCKGLRIYPHMLGYIIGDVQSSQTAEKVFVLVAPDNTPSIKGIERAGLKYVARLRGIRIGPLVLNRSGHKKQLSESR